MLIIALVAKSVYLVSSPITWGDSHGDNCTKVSKIEIMDDSEVENFEKLPSNYLILSKYQL